MKIGILGSGLMGGKLGILFTPPVGCLNAGADRPNRLASVLLISNEQASSSPLHPDPANRATARILRQKPGVSVTMSRDPATGDGLDEKCPAFGLIHVLWDERA